MASEEKIVNKIIPIETIVEVANYLEEQKEEYKKLFDRDEQKNKDLKYSEQVYEYKKHELDINYTIKFKDGRELKEPDYNWFIGMLGNLKAIERISISSSIRYSSNSNGEHKYMSLYTYVSFYETYATIRVDGGNMEEQVYRTHSYLRGVIENNEDRYNKTVKNRNFRIQSFCLSIGFVLSYIIYLVLNGMKAELPEIILQILNNKYGIILGQWFISALIGNILGFPIMMALYRNIVPNAKYSHYNSSSHKSVYVDNIEDYVSHCEVQIGKFADNGKNRMIIEKIYKVTSKVVLLQLVISVLLFLIIK